jgi:arylsulfatase A-like enzyme
MTRQLARWGAVLAAAAVLIWMLAPRAQPNVLLITVDALRPDFLSCYGGTHGVTAHLDALAERGVLFTQAVCDVPWTRGSLASLMTGRYATTHRVRSPFHRLAQDSATLAEVFRRAGYRTAAIVASFDLDHIFQLDQGFDTYDDRFDEPVVVTTTERPLNMPSIFYGDVDQDRGVRRLKLQSNAMRGDAEVSDAAIGWLRRAGARPFLLWVHYFGARERWTLDSEAPQVMRQYAPAVQRVDREVGRLLEALGELGLEQNTLVVLHGDHGQNLFERGGFGHGWDLYEPSLRVPLLMRWPQGLPAGRHVGALVRLVDVFPTVTELAGVDIANVLDGRSLVSLIRGADRDTAARGAVESYGETFLTATVMGSQMMPRPGGEPSGVGLVRRGIRSEQWMYICSEPSPLIDVTVPQPLPADARQAYTREELYDLTRDPQERNNVIAQEPATAAAFRMRLEQQRER